MKKLVELCFFGGDDTPVLGVVRCSVLAVMHTPVAVWAQCNDVNRRVRAAIADFVDVMRLKVGPVIWPKKGRGFSASFTNPTRPLEHVGADFVGSAINVSRASFGIVRRDMGSGVSAAATLVKGQVVVLLFIHQTVHGLNDRFHATHREEVDRLLSPIPVDRFRLAVLDDHFTFKSERTTSPKLGEHIEVTTFLGVLEKAQIGAGKGLMPRAPLAGILENGRSQPLVCVPVSSGAINGVNSDNARAGLGIENTCLLSAAGNIQNLPAGVVLAPNKWRWHSIPHSCGGEPKGLSLTNKFRFGTEVSA